MQYWLVTTEFPPGGGGIGPYCLYTAEMLARAGVQVRVFHRDGTVKGAAIHRLSPAVTLVRYCNTRLDGERIDSPTSSSAEVSWITSEVLEEGITRWGAPDVIEFQDFGAVGYFTMLKRFCFNERFADVRIVQTAHRPILHTHATEQQSVHRLPVFFTTQMEKWTYKAADAIFYPAQFMMERLGAPDMRFQHNAGFLVRNPYQPDSGSDLWPALEAILETDNGQDPEEKARRPAARALDRRFADHVTSLAAWPPGWRRPRRAPGSPMLLLAKLQDQKGVRDLLGFLDRWWDEGGDAPLRVHGRDAMLESQQCSMQGRLEQTYRRRIDQGLLSFAGEYARSEVGALVSASQIVFLPFREECMPYATLEVIAAGATPLCAPGGGQIELIHPAWRDRLVYDPSNYEDFCLKLQWLRAQTKQRLAEVSADLQEHIRTVAGYEAATAQKLNAIARTPHPSTRTSFPYIEHIERSSRPSAPSLAAPGSPPTAPAVRPNSETAGRVSVVIPYFNMQTYVVDAIDSVLANEHPDIEIIVVDDGSTDAAAGARLQELENHPVYRHYLRVVRKPNGGLASARNAGGAAATGEYLLFLDADDCIAPTFISRCLSVITRYDNVSYASSWLQEFGESSGRWVTWPCDFPYLLYHSTQHCTILARRQDWLRHGWNDPRMALGMEDYESFVRMTAAGVRGVAIPQFLFRYRVRGNSMMRAFTPETLAFLYRLIREKHPALFARYAADLAPLAAENGHGAFVSDPTRETAAAAEMFADRRNNYDYADRRYRAGDHAEALLRVRGALLRDPRSPGSNYLLAQALIALGCDPADALRACSRSIELAPNDYWPQLSRARLLLEFGMRKEGRAELARTFASHPAACKSAVWMAEQLLYHGAFASAWGLADAARTRGETGASLVAQKAALCAGRLHVTEEFRMSAFAWSQEQKPGSLLGMAMAGLHARDTTAALAVLDQIAPGDALSAIIEFGAPAYADLLASFGKEEVALALLDWAARRRSAMRPARSGGRDNIAALKSTILAAREARRDLSQAIWRRDPDAVDSARAALFAAAPHHLEGRCAVADLQFALSDDLQALAELDAALGTPAAAAHPWYWVRRLRAAARLDRPETALAAVEACVACDLTCDAGLDLLAEINTMIKDGRPVMAHACLEAMRPHFDALDDVRLWWASTAIDSGIHDDRVDIELSAIVSQTAETDRKTWAVYHRGRLAAARGDSRRASEFARALSQSPSPEAREAAADLLRKLKPG